MKRITTILVGILGSLMGIGFILPALAKMRDTGAMPTEVVGHYTLGIALALIGCCIAFFGARRRKVA